MGPNSIEELFDELDRIAPDGYNFGFHIRFSRPALVRNTYDDAWGQTYAERKFILNDPAVIWGLTQDAPRRWRDIDIPDPLGVFDAARKAGYKHGVSFGYGPLEQRSLGSCASKARDFSDTVIERVHEIVVQIHGMIAGEGILSERQKEALQMLATGMTYDQICDELSISRTALKSRLSNARKSLAVANNADAVRAAVDQGLVKTKLYTGIVQGYPSENPA